MQRNAGLASPEAIAIGAYLIRGRGHTVLVDTGTGGVNGVGGALIATLALLGVRPEEIDTILLTHAHPDHIGGVADGNRRPRRIPTPRCSLPSRERAYWLAASTLDNASDRGRRNVLLVHRVLAICAAQIREVDGEETVAGIHPCPSARPYARPYRVSSRDGRYLAAHLGDIVHFPTIQTTRTSVSVAFDASILNRPDKPGNVCCAKAASEQWLIAGMHLGLPGFARVVETPYGYLLQSV